MRKAQPVEMKKEEVLALKMKKGSPTYEKMKISLGP